MCGIIGYIGKQDALPILLDGLRNLEYRGYDSAGLMVWNGSRSVLEKSVGKVLALEQKLSNQGKDFTGAVGIAHTRWATHGGVTEANAHPHVDCHRGIFVVHNGIIENYKELKIQLKRAGHVFRSETDSEVLPHFIEDVRKRNPKLGLDEAVRLVLKQVRGTYGIVVFDRRDPEKIVAARNFSPLLLGRGDGECIVASDPAGVLKITNNVLYLKDGEIVTVTAEGYRIRTIGNQIVDRPVEKLDLDFKTAKKGKYPHFMLKEIFEEPDAVRNSFRGRLDREEGKVKLGGLKGMEKKLRDAKRIIICACGSAYFAGRVGEYMLEEYAGIPVEVDVSSEFRYRKPVFQKGDVLLVISQSGETADTLASLHEAQEKGVTTLGIVNVVGSTISRETDAGVYQHIGPEIGVAASKSFVSQVTVLSLLTLFFGRQRGLSLVMGQRIIRELEQIPALMESILKQKNRIKRLVEKYARYSNFFFLGRKYNFPVALEGALKLKEITYVHAEGYSAGEMKHGPIAMVSKQFPSVVIATQDSVYEKMISNIQEIKARNGPVIAVATEGDKKISSLVDDVIYVPKTLEMLSPLITVLPLHLFAYYFGIARGYDVDKPRNLAKSVTVE